MSTDLAVVARISPEHTEDVQKAHLLRATVVHVHPGATIGNTVDTTHDQLLCVVAGNGIVTVKDVATAVGPGSVVLIPSLAERNVRNTHPADELLLVVVHAPMKLHRSQADYVLAAPLDLAAAALANTDYKRVVQTAPSIQATVMRLGPSAAIGDERHAEYDQLVCVVAGMGIVVVDGLITAVMPGSIVLIPGGARHDVRNTDLVNPLHLIVAYAPPKFARDAVIRH